MESFEITFLQAQPTVEGFSEDFTEEETANEARAGNGFRALEVYADKAYGTKDNEPLEQGIRDLIGDLLHLANKFGIDTDEILERANGCYKDELHSPIG